MQTIFISFCCVMKKGNHTDIVYGDCYLHAQNGVTRSFIEDARRRIVEAHQREKGDDWTTTASIISLFPLKEEGV